MNRRGARATAVAMSLVALAVPALTGCAPSTAAADGRLSVVASTDVYGEIAREIGGDAVTVTSIIDRPALDPHEYEASARDQLAVSRADLLIVNGGGYDPFMDALIAATETRAPVIRAVAGGHDHAATDSAPAAPAAGAAEYAATATDRPAAAATDRHEAAATDRHDATETNEHAFYDPAAMGELADEIAETLVRLDPEHATSFAANAQTLAAGIDRLEDSIAVIAAGHHGTPVFATEPLAGRLLAAAHLVDIAPPAFSEAAESGRDVPPATLLRALRMLSAREATVLIVNEQTAGAASGRLIDTARTAGVPVVELTETLPREESYQDWMGQNISALAKALER